MIGGALVGTFLGVFLAYGFVGPIAAKMNQTYEEDAQFYAIIRDCLVAYLQGHSAPIVVELAARQRADDAAAELPCHGRGAGAAAGDPLAADRMSREPRPIIIRRPIVAGGHGHHGGAWKVAYADFVTAMMAFFLLLWLISSASDETKKGPRRLLQQRHGQHRSARRCRRRARRHDRDAECGAAPADLALRPAAGAAEPPRGRGSARARHSLRATAADTDGELAATELAEDAARESQAVRRGQGRDPGRAADRLPSCAASRTIC